MGTVSWTCCRSVCFARMFDSRAFLHETKNDICAKVHRDKNATANPPDDRVAKSLIGDEKTESNVCETADDDCSAEPEMDMCEPSTVGGFIAHKTHVMVPSYNRLYWYKSDDRCPKEMV